MIKYVFKIKVYFNYTIGTEPKWIYLGKICNQKPSAIFKLSNLKHEANNLLVQPFGATMNSGSNLNVAMIGISVESISQIDSMLPASQANANNLNSFTDFVQKMPYLVLSTDVLGTYTVYLSPVSGSVN